MEWLNGLLGASTAATLWAIFRGVQMLRTGTDSRTAAALADLEKLRREADVRANVSRADAERYLDLADYWRSWAGTLEYVSRQAGVALPDRPPLPDPPPSPAVEV